MACLLLAGCGGATHKAPTEVGAKATRPAGGPPQATVSLAAPDELLTPATAPQATDTVPPTTEPPATTSTVPPVVTTTTEAPTTTTEPARPAQPVSRGTTRTACGGWYDLVASYDWPVDTACRILLCESNGDADAVNRSSGATGLFQILRGPTDPADNVALAHDMWAHRGWQPWVCR